MSKGHGRVQRFILDYLNAEPLETRGLVTAHELALKLYGARRDGELSPAQVESVRRAIRSLAAAGLVDRQEISPRLFERGRPGGPQWPYRMAVRLPYTAEERQKCSSVTCSALEVKHKGNEPTSHPRVISRQFRRFGTSRKLREVRSVRHSVGTGGRTYPARGSFPFPAQFGEHPG